ncbi:hypothetical protein [Microbacterium sp. LWH3-1.2]|uniref:hypothetical protein n=1 Tax=Microbacterium sp. LWH3-1.2 TaxID=3135256 RepID=UPI0034240B1C
MSPAIAAHEYSPWEFWSEASPSEREVQLVLQQIVAGRPDHELGKQCLLSELAEIDNDSLRLGDRTYVAAGASLTATSAPAPAAAARGSASDPTGPADTAGVPSRTRRRPPRSALHPPHGESSPARTRRR